MTSFDNLLQSLRHSPQLPQILSMLQHEFNREQQRRQRFYADMTPEQKVEFIDGEIVLHSPARNKHLDATGNLFRLLSTYVLIRQVGQVKHEKCLCVFPRNDYEPDVVFFGPEKANSFHADTMKFPVPDLVVEVLSESTAERDRGVKYEDYAANGVGEYWIVNADAQVVEQYLLSAHQYRLHMKSSSGQLRSQVIANLEFPISAIFDEQENLLIIARFLQPET